MNTPLPKSIGRPATAALEAATGAAGANGTNGTNGSNGGSGGGNTTTSGLLKFAAEVNTGDSKEKITGSAGGLNENCTVVVDTTSLGKQQVCTYTEGDKIVTATYLNDRVISASRSGF